MCVCIYVCMCVCVCMYAYVCMYVCMYACVFMVGTVCDSKKVTYAHSAINLFSNVTEPAQTGR